MSNASTPAPSPLEFDNLKPREERDFHELYPDLQEVDSLAVVWVATTDIPDVHEPSGKDLYTKKPLFKKFDIEHTEPRFPKILLEHGFKASSSSTTTATAQPTLVRPLHKTLDNTKVHVAYDIDEQDDIYLKARNRNSNSGVQLTPEVFEILMTVLEHEWMQLESQIGGVGSINSAVSSDKQMLALSSNNEKYGNDDGIEPGSIYDQKCAVCSDSDCGNSNAIVFCDGCDIAVHQECYGIAFIPEGQWLCRKCMINKNRETQCMFCPSTTGAFKQLDNSKWSHVICGLWINELYFANPVYMEPIEGLDLIPKSRWKLCCYICKQRVGACIQCLNRNCFQAYHPTCAKRAGLYMLFTQGVAAAITNKQTLRTYCERHAPQDSDTNAMIQGIKKTRLFFRDRKILKAENERLARDQKLLNKLNIFKWRTEYSTPIAPKVFSDKLFELLVKFKVDRALGTSAMVRDLEIAPNRTKEETERELRAISDEVCRWWCLKRELKRGAPLIRSMCGPQHSLYADGDRTDELEFARTLTVDVDKMIMMSAQVCEREKLKRELATEVRWHMIETVYFPLTYIIRRALDFLNNKYDSSKVLRNHKVRVGEVLALSDVIDKNDKYGYDSILEVEADINRLLEHITSTNKPSTTTYKVATRWILGWGRMLPTLHDEEREIQSHVKDGALQVDGVEVNGGNIDFVPINRKKILEDFELSEIELDDEGYNANIDTEENQRIMDDFLRGDVTDPPKSTFSTQSADCPSIPTSETVSVNKMTKFKTAVPTSPLARNTRSSSLPASPLPRRMISLRSMRSQSPRVSRLAAQRSKRTANVEGSTKRSKGGRQR